MKSNLVKTLLQEIFGMGALLLIACARAEPAALPVASQPTEASPQIPSLYEDRYTPRKGGLYEKDDNIWVYSKAFAERFGMPASWITVSADLPPIPRRMAVMAGQRMLA